MTFQVAENTGGARPVVVLAVTSHASLRLMEGFPHHLADQGWDVHVVCSAAPASDCRVSFHSIAMRRPPSPMRDLVGLIQWILLLHRLRPDLVVAGTPKAGLLGSLAAAVVRVPSRIYLLRGLRLETERGPLRRVLWAMEWLSARSATCVQAVSHSLRDLYIAESLAKPEKIWVVGSGSSNGVDIDVDVAPQVWGDGAFTVGFVGRASVDKGLPLLLDAMAELDPEQFQLIIVGSPEPEDYLIREISRRNLDPSVVMSTGFLDDPSPVIGSFDVLCLPTKREGFPNVVLEAAARAVPAVVTSTTGAVDSVEDGVTGWVVPSDDPKALALALSQARADRAGTRARGAAARDRVMAYFSRTHVWAETIKLYEDEIARRTEQKVGNRRCGC